MKVKLFRLRVKSYFPILLILLANSLSYVSAQQSGEAYIYCFTQSQSSELLLHYFNDKPEWNVTVYSLNNSATYERFLAIVNTLILFVIKHPIPEGGCVECAVRRYGSEWITIAKSYASPLIGFFLNKKLSAITIGTTNKDIIDQALKVNAENDVIIFTHNQTYTLSDEAVRAKLEELFLDQENSGKMGVNLSLSLVSSVLLLALSDSVNPCTFAVFTALLLIALCSLHKSKVAIIGLSFILAIFVGYYALGLGLLQILIAMPYMLYVYKIVAVVGLFIGAFSIIQGLKPKFKSPVPKSFQRFMNLWINKSYVSPTASFLLGLASTFCLLPCSGGPYIVGLGLLSILKPIQAYILLAVYNIIFVAPLIVILAAILISSDYSRKIKAFRSRKLGVMELLSGILLVAICIYTLLSK